MTQPHTFRPLSFRPTRCADCGGLWHDTPAQQDACNQRNGVTYRITSFGTRLDGKQGVTGVLIGRYTEAELERWWSERERRGEVRIELA